MSFLVDVLSVMMDLGANGHILCFVSQFRVWYELLKGKVKYMFIPTKKENVLMSDDPPT